MFESIDISPNNNEVQRTGITFIDIVCLVCVFILISSVVLGIFNVVVQHGNDALKREDFYYMQLGLQAYFIDHGFMPHNYLLTDKEGIHYSNLGNGNAIAFEDTANPDNPTTDSGRAYNKSMQQLVDNGLIHEIPHSPDKNTPYGYYDYGHASPEGAVFATELQFGDASSIGVPGSCRPLPTNSGNWCTISLSRDYCLCSMY